MHFYFITFTSFNVYILVQVSFALQVNGLTGTGLGTRDLKGDTVFPVFIKMPMVGFYCRVTPFFEISIL